MIILFINIESLSILVSLIIFVVIAVMIFSRSRKNTSKTIGMTPPNMGLRGKTKEQKKVIKYFMSTGILGMIFRISDSTFDSLLNSKADEITSGIDKRALEAHGIDADEVKEIQPVLVENYYQGSRYFKMFRDHSFRASEYQMTYLMFSDKQMYAYSYIFDITSDETNEQTTELFFEDITNIEVAKTQREYLMPRPTEYIVGGWAGIIIGILMMALGANSGGGLVFLGFLLLIGGIILLAFLGFSRRVVDNLVLRLTVAGDEFDCAMNINNIAAIQGMKAKIREKKEIIN